VLEHIGPTSKLLERLSGGNSGVLKSAKVLEFGLLAAIWDVAKDLGISNIIDEHIHKRNQGLSCGEYSVLAMLCRAVSATSKASFSDWYTSTILKIISPAKTAQLTSQQFWVHMKYFTEKIISEIEIDIAKSIVVNSKIDLETLLFDATNFDTYINTKTESALAARGRAKSKKYNLKVVGLSLLITKESKIPLFSYVYPGNHNDKTMFGDIVVKVRQRIKQLKKRYSDVTMIFDGGNTSEANILELNRGKIHFITSLTITHHLDLLDIPSSDFESFISTRLSNTTAFRTSKRLWDKDITVIVVRSQTFFEGQLQGINESLQKKRTQLSELKTKLRKSQLSKAKGKGYTKHSLSKLLDSITAGQYIKEILTYTIEESDGYLSFIYKTSDVAFKRLKEKRLGKRILATTRNNWKTSEIITGYRDQATIESLYKFCKNHDWVCFRPFGHWTDDTVRAHLFFCTCALQIMTVLHKRVIDCGIDITMERMCSELSSIRLVITLSSIEGKMRSQTMVSEMSSIQQRLFKSLNIEKYTIK